MLASIVVVDLGFVTLATGDGVDGCEITSGVGGNDGNVCVGPGVGAGVGAGESVVTVGDNIGSVVFVVFVAVVVVVVAVVVVVVTGESVGGGVGFGVGGIVGSGGQLTPGSESGRYIRGNEQLSFRSRERSLGAAQNGAAAGNDVSFALVMSSSNRKFQAKREQSMSRLIDICAPGM